MLVLHLSVQNRKCVPEQRQKHRQRLKVLQRSQQVSKQLNADSQETESSARLGGPPFFLQHPPSKYFSTLDPFRVAPLGVPPFLQHPPSKYFSTLDPFRVAPLGGPPFFATHPSKYFSTLKSPRMCLKKCGLLCPCSGGLARGTSVIAFVMDFVIAFVIQTLDQIHFTI